MLASCQSSERSRGSGYGVFRMFCSVCSHHPATVGHLCRDCHKEIAKPFQFEASSVEAIGVLHGERAMLIDSWGRCHPVGARCVLGRLPEGPGLVIGDASISRHHAHLIHEATSNTWTLRDLGSKNGTTVNNARISEATAIGSGDRLGLGRSSFFFVARPTALRRDRPTTRMTVAGVARPQAASLASSSAHVEPPIARPASPTLEMSFAEYSGSGGAILTIAGQQVLLSPIQYKLLYALASRMHTELSQPASVRGFIRTTELAAVVAKAQASPNEQHVKQLVRRIRRMLVDANIGDIIETRPRFGYRLCVQAKAQAS